MAFERVSSTLNFPEEEQQILRFWRDNGIFAKSLATKDEAGNDKPVFVFYEGPPTANGLPHNGHVLTRVMKDLLPRYKTMRGYVAPRKAGWDTHGLPVEVEVEKELRIHGKAAIEAFGIEPFVRRCIDSVFRYQTEWQKITERLGFWVDLEDAYVTFHKSYVESVWWALAELSKKGLLYQGHKVVWWWAQGGTALSSGEVGQGYKTVDDPSAYVAFPVQDDPKAGEGPDLGGAKLVVWTTTPWTLSSNMFAAVSAKADYVLAELSAEGQPTERVVVAEALLAPLAEKLKRESAVLARFKGARLEGVRYQPPFDLYASEAHPALWRVLSADFVTLDSGTGIVHLAPAFGEDDHTRFRKELREHPDLPLLCAVNADGTFIEAFAPYAGRWVKDCDKDLQKDLAARGLLLHQEIYRHDYPFCWRADDDPLIQFARPAWYIRTTARIDQALENNQAVRWLPEHIKNGRFGDFLTNNVDWALSRERYWGTPLPVWINDVTGTQVVVSSTEEILAKNPKAFDHFHAAKANDPSLSEHLIVHKPWIDEVTWQEPGEEGTYRRVPDVIDCWFDSGCMPFAQWGYPHQGHAEMARSFPADFISEAIDQTRGWFYSLLMIASLVFDDEGIDKLRAEGKGELPKGFPRPFSNCMVLGHVTDREGKKESKSKGNYTPPEVILDQVGMEFAVLTSHPHEQPKAGEARIAREDLEGLDLKEGAKVSLRGPSGQSLELVVRAAKRLPRRVVLLEPGAVEALGARHTHKPDVRPVEVGALPADERVWLHDPATPAPGADAFRWFFYASNPPWNATRHSLSAVRDLQKETLIRLRNVYSFFCIYADIDGFVPSADPATVAAAETELDRWILSELAQTIEGVTTALDDLDIFTATGKLTAFIDGLSNWYVRRSRDRFWGAGMTDDKRAAMQTLYDCLVTLSKLLAPFVPFFAESMHQNLVVKQNLGKESVHLESWPAVDAARVDLALSAKMAAAREIVSLGLQVRATSKLKVRQPLGRAHVLVKDRELALALRGCADLVREELNVLDVDWVSADDAGKYVQYTLKPNFRALGQRGLGREAQTLKKSMTELSAAQSQELAAHVAAGEPSIELFGVQLQPGDLDLAFETKEGFAAAGGRTGVVVLDCTLNDELHALGFLRELLSRVQAARKEAALDFSDRIALTIEADEPTSALITRFESEISQETLAVRIERGAAGEGAIAIEDNGFSARVSLVKA